jgi:DNA-binding GntR family transcriptional regulator
MNDPRSEVRNTLPANKGLTRRSLSDSVYETMIESLAAGHLKGSTELNEVTLAQELNVSRTPIHEAITRLVAEGIVEQGLNRKFRVREFTPADLAKVYEMRKCLECLAVGQAVTQMPRDILSALRSEAKALAAASNDAHWGQRAAEFHRRVVEAIASGCGNVWLERDIARYQVLDRSFGRRAEGLAGLRQTLREHAELLKVLDALEAQDGPKAQLKMAAFVEAREKAVLKELALAENQNKSEGKAES